MKKILAITTLFLSLTAAAFACKPAVDPKVENDFNNKFSHAQEVSWVTGSSFSKAEFNFNGTWMYAWYNAKGEYLGLTRNISSAFLPSLLQDSLKTNYAQYWITAVVEETNSNRFSYYITLENAGTKVVLKSYGGSDWSSFKKVKKI